MSTAVVVDSVELVGILSRMSRSGMNVASEPVGFIDAVMNVFFRIFFFWCFSGCFERVG